MPGEDDSQNEDEHSTDTFSDSSESSKISRESHRVEGRRKLDKKEKDASKWNKILKQKYCQRAGMGEIENIGNLKS
jgi:hypothetical protein